MTTEEKVKEIKRGLRSLMNGVTAQSLRDKGTVYKISWGSSLNHLQEVAEEYGKDYYLAVELWKSEVRECKLLATMIMPPDEFLPDLAQLWLEELPSQEVAEHLVLNLLQHVPYSADVAYQLIAADDQLRQICGYTLFGRLFMQGRVPNERGAQEYIDQAAVSLKSDSLSVRHSVYNSLIRFADMGEEYENMAEPLLNS